MASTITNPKTDTGWLEIPLKSGVTIQVKRYRIVNDICYLSVSNVGNWNFTAGSWQIFGTLPATCRPSQYVAGAWTGRNGEQGEFQIAVDGQIGVLPYQTGSNFAFACAFPVGG